MEKMQEKLQAHLPLLKEATKLSATSTYKVVKTIIVFGLFSLIFLIIGLIYLFKGELVTFRVVLVILILVLGIGATCFAATKKYQQVLIEAGKIYFDKLDVFKTKLAENLIDKLESGANTKVGTRVNQIVNVPQIINNSYEKVPKIITKAITYLIAKVPLIEYIDSINKEFISQGKEEKVNYLVAKTNNFFNENIFSVNNTKTIRIVFWVMTFIQIMLIYFLNE
ncbi:hypothetical protein FIA58_020745 [Flavobacterium jejuense]|uniref:SMODS and SLOG-associating 2TM effector domain-containing protein n=1 Tax=Flavobacterium jejuense TaxID=1544455 RepID=A0ABX0IZ60_9FLAO|nr:hypothetical protein [Flavobacterium jejuense]NHN28114.1 hypothetical protein [Flavobacterium jejuense]